MHRFDAEYPSGVASGFDPAFASDGIDELVVGFAQRRKGFPVTSAQSRVIRAEDTNDHWHLTIGPEGISTIRVGGPEDVTLTGDATDLYLVLWNRAEDSRATVTGDHALLDEWHGNQRVRRS